jgi:hypothetical protein
MPRARKTSKDPKSEYAWIAGKKRSIAHESLIAKGGFGEVHKVRPFQAVFSLTKQMKRITRGDVKPMSHFSESFRSLLER